MFIGPLSTALPSLAGALVAEEARHRRSGGSPGTTGQVHQALLKWLTPRASQGMVTKKIYIYILLYITIYIYTYFYMCIHIVVTYSQYGVIFRNMVDWYKLL